ncbi:hypothetical protein ABPG74_010508 [Tetrahymena malaccensis]
MTDLFPKISIDINQPLKALNRKGNSNLSSLIDYSKFQIKEPIIAQQYNVAIEKNFSQIQTQINTEECTQFQDVIGCLNKVIKRYLICSDNALIDKLRNFESYFKQQICFDKDFFTYPQLLNRVIDLSFVLSEKIEQLQYQNEESKEDFRMKQEKKNTEYMNLEQKYEKLKENFFNQLNSQINQYKQKMDDLEKQNEILKSEKEKHTEQLTRIHENYDKVFYEKYSNYDQTLNEYKAIEKRFELQNKDFNELKTQYTNIYDTYRKTLNDLKMFKERNALNENKIQLLQTEIQSLQADNQIYKQTYTPRPNLIEVLEVSKIEYEKEKKQSTSQLVLILKNALSQKPNSIHNYGSTNKTSLENIQQSIIPISPLKQPYINQDRKRMNAISLNSTVANNNNLSDIEDQNIMQQPPIKNQSKKLTPTAQKSKQNIQFSKANKDVYKTDNSNISATDIKKQRKKIAIDLSENMNDQSKVQTMDNKKVSIHENLQKESKSLQIGDHIKRRVKSTHQKDFQNRSTINISNMHAGDLSFQQQQRVNENTLDNSLVDYSKRKANKNDVEFDSKYDVRISQSQVYVDEQASKQFQENYTPREQSLLLGNEQANQMIDLANKENYSSVHQIIIPKPISTFKRSHSNIERKDIKNVGSAPSNLTTAGQSNNPILKIQKTRLDSLNNKNNNMQSIEAAFQQNQSLQQGIKFCGNELEQYATEQKQNKFPSQDYSHNYMSNPCSSQSKNMQQKLISNQVDSEVSQNILSNLSNKITQIQNSNSKLKKDIHILPISKTQNILASNNENQSAKALDSNFNKFKNLQQSNFHINIPQQIQANKQSPSFFDNTIQSKQYKNYNSTGNLQKQDEFKVKSNIQIFENQCDVTDESGIKKSPHVAVNRNNLDQQQMFSNCQPNQINNIQNILSSTNAFNFTNNNLNINNNNNNNNLSAFFEQSTVCFNSTENEDSNNLIRVFDKHMQEKQDLFKIQIETSELLGETNHNQITNTRKLNGENTIIFDEKVFIGNTGVYQQTEYIIFKNEDFNRLLLKQEAIQELLVQQQMKIKYLENQINQQNAFEKQEMKQQMLQQIQQDLQSNQRLSRFSNQQSDQNNKIGQFNFTDTDFRQFNQKQNTNHNFFTNKFQQDKDDDCKTINNITEILNIQTDESHSQFDVSLNTFKSQNVTKYSSNPLDINPINTQKYQILANSIQQNQNTNMISTFGQEQIQQLSKDGQFNKQSPQFYLKNINQTNLAVQEKQIGYKQHDMQSLLKSSMFDQSRIMDENEEGQVRQSIKETCRNKNVQGNTQELNFNCFIDGVETFRGNQTTTASHIQNNVLSQQYQNVKVLENNPKPPKIPQKKIFSERSEYSSIQSNTSTIAGHTSGNISNFVSTDRSHSIIPQRSKSINITNTQSNQIYNNVDKNKINTQQSDDIKQNSEKYNSSYSTLPSNNTHHFRSQGDYEYNILLNGQSSQDHIKQDQNCNIF